MSVELGRVLLIDDRDCDTLLPSPINEHLFNEDDDEPVQAVPQVYPSAGGANFLLTTIHIVRMIGELLRSLQSDVIAPQTLQAFDSHFQSCQAAFPQDCQIYHPQPLEPKYLYPIVQLQNCRIVLHRHNLSTACPPDVRRAAIDSCVKAARETVHLLRRVQEYRPNRETLANAIAGETSSLVCTHIWRCILFLLFAGHYDEAQVCIAICAAIGDFRPVNIACGRYIHGFVRHLSAKASQNVDLLKDEMMIALVSGDLQGSTESSWVWNGSETGPSLSNRSSPQDGAMPKKECIPTETSTTLSPEERKEWGDWNQVGEMVKQLQREQRERAATTIKPKPATTSDSSRISIANII